MKRTIFSVLLILALIVAYFIFYTSITDGLRPTVIVSIIVISGFIFSLSYLKTGGTQYQQNLILLGGISITIISWFVTGYINNENEKNRNKLSIEQSILQSKRDLKIKVLLDAYFRLENSDHRDTVPVGHQTNPYDYIYLKYSESALSSIQLLAGDSTIRMANLYTLSNGKAHFNELLVILRNELRKELELSDLPHTKEFNPSEFRWYRKLNRPGLLTPAQAYELTIKLNEFDRELIK